MNKRQKIIVSIIGITIVLLALLGITYAYYLTRIEGNTNTNSVSITTAKLELLYGDGNGEIIIENLMPGQDITPKTFTVTNNGNSLISEYRVSIEEITNTLSRPEDLSFELTCVQKNEDSEIEGTCNGNTGGYPQKNISIVSNQIDVGYIHEYSLKIIYVNHTDIDQSEDMGSIIKGKIQIYDPLDTIDIGGTVNNYEEGDYIEINSEPKISQIKNGMYSLVGIKPGTHTLKVMNSEGLEKSTKQLTIQKGSEEGIVDNIITITNDSQSVNIGIDATTQTYSIATTISKFEYGTLAYNIMKNAQLGTNGTTYSKEPLTKVGKNTSGTLFNLELSDEGEVTMSVSSKYVNNYITYADEYEVDENNAISLIEPKTCKYSECFNSLVGKYIVDEYIWSTSFSTNKVYNNTNLKKVFKVLEVGEDNLSDVKLNKYSITKRTIDEKTLSETEDDYGTSYYFRGKPTDNYVNFAGFCWRIVRIEGNNNVRLILASRNGTCEVSGNVTTSSGLLEGNKRYGHTSSSGKYIADFDNSSGSTYAMKYLLDEWYHTNLINYSNYLNTYEQCVGDKDSRYDYYGAPIEYTNNDNMYYASFYRYNYGTPTLKCEDSWAKTSPVKLFPITADEVVFAGSVTGSSFVDRINHSNNYLTENANDEWWTITLSHDSRINEKGDYAYLVASDGYLHHGASWSFGGSSGITAYLGVRPAISLKSTAIVVSGDGTKNNPYVIK